MRPQRLQATIKRERSQRELFVLQIVQYVGGMVQHSLHGNSDAILFLWWELFKPFKKMLHSLSHHKGHSLSSCSMKIICLGEMFNACASARTLRNSGFARPCSQFQTV